MWSPKRGNEADDRRNAAAGPRWSASRRYRRGRRGVSEVIGTILILALTVVLFSAIFYFVSTLPSPAASSTSQFSAVLGISGGSNPLETNINITYQAGPTLTAATTAIYLSSNLHGANFACTRTGTYGNPYTPTQAIAGAPNIWTAGQTWTLALAVGTTVCPGGVLTAAGDNVTISIVNTGTNTLLFHVVLPGTTPNVPPIFTNYGVYQKNPGSSQPYTIYTSIRSTDLNFNSVYVNSSLWTGMKAQPMQQCGNNPNAVYSCSGGSGIWSFTPAYACPGCFPTPQPNTQYSFVITAYDNGTGVPHPQHNTVIFYFTFVGSSASKAQFLIRLTANPGNPSVSQSTALTATFTNVGGSQATGITVTYRSSATGLLHAVINDGALNVSISNFTTVYWKAGPSTGDYTIWVWVNATGGVTNVQSLALTVFPRTLVIDETGVTPGTNASTDTFTYLETDLNSAAVPFNTTIVPPGASVIAWDCSAPTCLNNYDVIIWELSNSGQLTASDQVAIECATGTSGGVCPTSAGHRSIWLLGANALAGTASTNPTLLADLGVNGPTLQTLATSVNGVAQLSLPAQAVVPTVGITSANIYMDAYLPGQSEGGYLSQPNYDTIGTAGGSQAYMTSAKGTVAVALNQTGAYKAMTMPFELAAMSRALPWGGTTYVTALGEQASVAFDTYNFLANFTTINPHRSADDWAVSGVSVQPSVLTFNNPAFVNFTARNNGPTPGTFTAELLVNGLPYYVAGSPVTATVGPVPMGGSVRAAFNWTPSVIGFLSVGVEILPPSTDTLPANNEMSNSLFARQLYVHYNVLLVDGTQSGIAGASCQGAFCHETTPAVYGDLIAAGFPASTITVTKILTPCGILSSTILPSLQSAPPRYNMVVWNLGDVINGTSCPLNNRNAQALISFLNNGGTGSSLLMLGGGLLTNVGNGVTKNFLGTYMGVLMPTPAALTLTATGPIYGQTGDLVGNGLSIPYPTNGTSYYYQAANASGGGLVNQYSMYYNDVDPWTFHAPPMMAAQNVFSTAAGWHTAYWDFNFAAVGAASGVGPLQTAVLQFATFSGRLLPFANAVVDAPDITFATSNAPYLNFNQMHPQLAQQYLVQANVTNLGGSSAIGIGVQILDGSHILGSSSVSAPPSSVAPTGAASAGLATVSVPWTPLYGSQNAITVRITTITTALIEPGIAQTASWNLTVYFFYDSTSNNQNLWTHDQLFNWAQDGSGSPPVGQQIYYSDDHNVPTGPLTNDPGSGTAGGGGAGPCNTYGSHACNPAFNGTPGAGTFTGFSGDAQCVNGGTGVEGCWYVLPNLGGAGPSECQVAIAIYGGSCNTGQNSRYYASCIDTYDGIGQFRTTALNYGWYLYLPTAAQGAPGPGNNCPPPGGGGGGATNWVQSAGICYLYLWECTSNFYQDNQNNAGTSSSVDWIYSVPVNLAAVNGKLLTSAQADWWQAYSISPYQNGGIVCVTTTIGNCPTGHGGTINGNPSVITPGPGYSGTIAWEDSAGKCEVIPAFTGASTGFNGNVPNSWQYETVNLTPYIGQSQVYIAFGYVQGTPNNPCAGSASPLGVGWYVDQFEIRLSGGTTTAFSENANTCPTPGVSVPTADVWGLQTSAQMKAHTNTVNLSGAPTGSAWLAGATTPSGGNTSLNLNPNMWDSLYTRTIDLSSAQNATLTFNYVWDRNNLNLDPPEGLILDATPVLANGATSWTQIWMANVINGVTQSSFNNQWHFASVNLQGYVGSVIKLRFTVGTNCGGDGDDPGTYNYPALGFAAISGIYLQGATTLTAVQPGPAVIAAEQAIAGASTAQAMTWHTAPPTVPNAASPTATPSTHAQGHSNEARSSGPLPPASQIAARWNEPNVGRDPENEA